MSRRIRVGLLLVWAGWSAVGGTPTISAQSAPVSLGLTVNDPAIAPGDTLVAGITVNNPAGGPLADVFFVILLPDGTTVVSLTPGGPRAGTLANLRTLAPVVRGVNLASAFSYRNDAFFTYAFTGIEPSGRYRIYFAAARAGGLDDGAINAGDLLAVATQDFAVSTQAAEPTVTIDQAAVLLPAQGVTRQLTATARDGSGNPLPGPITWTSSRPDQVSVDAGGVVRAVVANGSSQIVAHSGAVASPPLLVIATTTPAGATLVSDAQIASGPTETDPNAPPSADTTYRVVLRTVSPPAIGSLLINTGELPVAGRVVAVSMNGPDVTVTLGQASLPELFPTLEINEVLDLANVPVDIIPEVAAGYNVQRAGDTFTFTPKPRGPDAADRGRLAAVSALYPFTCESNIGMPIRLSTPPAFSIAFKPTLDVRYTSAGGLERLVLSAAPTFKADVGVTVTAGFQGTITCDADIFTIPVPIGGPLSLVVGGLVPVGIGFEIEGAVTVATMGADTAVETSTTAAIGIACTAQAGCGTVRDLGTPTLKATPKLDLPSIGNLRLEPSLNVYGQMKLAIGNRFLKSLRLDAIKAKVGGKFQGSFAPAVTQIADASYRSDYKLGLSAKASVGPKISDVAKRLGIGSITALEASISTVLAKSPAPATTSPVTADRATFTVGDTVTFTVRLDPATVNFLPGIGPYNVTSVVLVRGIGNPAVVGQVTAAPGQTVFTIPFAAPGPGTADQFTAFVLTALLPQTVFALEIGRAVGPGVTVVSQATTATVSGRAGPTSSSDSRTGINFAGAGLDLRSPTTSARAVMSSGAETRPQGGLGLGRFQVIGGVDYSLASSTTESTEASATSQAQLVLDLGGPSACRFDVTTEIADPQVFTGPVPTFSVTVTRDGVPIFQAAAAASSTQTCQAGRYVATLSTNVAASSGAGARTFVEQGRRTDLLISLIP